MTGTVFSRIHTSEGGCDRALKNSLHCEKRSKNRSLKGVARCLKNTLFLIRLASFLSEKNTITTMFYPSLYNIPGKTLLGPVYMEVEEESRLRRVTRL